MSKLSSNFKRNSVLVTEPVKNYPELHILIAEIAWSLLKIMAFSTSHSLLYLVVFFGMCQVLVHSFTYLWCTQLLFPFQDLICKSNLTWILCSYPPKEASKIAVSTAQQFSEDIKEVRCSSTPKFFMVKYDYFCSTLEFNSQNSIVR